ncbi:MAG: hypothetical protein A2W19_04495 [Spirochaetes bacterium RBG_16_49_21]|nr:MAG: hypothetical protein A2W19_04495 [Spirochaetes bacterium RBG_16_49_21]
MDNKALYKMHADFCKFMGNPKRIELLFTLNDGEMSVEEMATKMNIRMANLSQHLAIMRERGVVTVRREGTKIFYRVSNPKTLKACLMMRDVMFEQMREKLSILRETAGYGKRREKTTV